MSRVMEAGMEKRSGARSGARSDEPEARSEVRWSARRKEEVVLRLLRGEGLDALARETGQQLEGSLPGVRSSLLPAVRA